MTREGATLEAAAGGRRASGPRSRGEEGAGSPQEVADVVDERDRVVGRALRREIRARKLLHRGVAVLCLDGAGRIFVHRRTEHKDVFPALYDMFVAGMVLAGESYPHAARRELREELGVEGVTPRFLFKHLYRGRDNPSWNAVFEVRCDGPVTPLVEEIAWGAFLPPEVLARRLHEWPFVPDGLEVYRRYLAER